MNRRLLKKNLNSLGRILLVVVALIFILVLSSCDRHEEHGVEQRCYGTIVVTSYTYQGEGAEMDFGNIVAYMKFIRYSPIQRLYYYSMTRCDKLDTVM